VDFSDIQKDNIEVEVKGMMRAVMIGMLLMVAMGVQAQEKGMKMDLWPNGAMVASSDKEDKAELTVYLPDAKKATGRAVVCCPGGGYSHLAMDHEGHQWATFFNNQGIALIVLKYRMPHGNPMVPVSDAEQAIKTVRKNAINWHIDRTQIGIMGFSAGGHLASTIATHSTGEAAPNFQILFYPVITMDMGFTHKGSHDNLLGTNHSKKEWRRLEADYSNDLRVNRTTPRAFLALSDDDKVVPAANGFGYYEQLYKHDVPASIHIYPTGGHGWGYRESFEYHYQMIFELKAWLESF
jgi:acetyl esterase/lipase